MIEEIYEPKKEWFRIVDHIYRTCDDPERPFIDLARHHYEQSDETHQGGPLVWDESQYIRHRQREAQGEVTDRTSLWYLKFCPEVLEEKKFGCLTAFSSYGEKLFDQDLESAWMHATEKWLDRLSAKQFQLWAFNSAVGRFTPLSYEVLIQSLTSAYSDWLQRNGHYTFYSIYTLLLAKALHDGKFSGIGHLVFTTPRVLDVKLRSKVGAPATAIERLMAAGRLPPGPGDRDNSKPYCLFRGWALQNGAAGAPAMDAAIALWDTYFPQSSEVMTPYRKGGEGRENALRIMKEQLKKRK
jgi:hypothetical protein